MLYIRPVQLCQHSFSSCFFNYFVTDRRFVKINETVNNWCHIRMDECCMTWPGRYCRHSGCTVHSPWRHPLSLHVGPNKCPCHSHINQKCWVYLFTTWHLSGASFSRAITMGKWEHLKFHRFPNSDGPVRGQRT